MTRDMDTNEFLLDLSLSPRSFPRLSNHQDTNCGAVSPMALQPAPAPRVGGSAMCVSPSPPLLPVALLDQMQPQLEPQPKSPAPRASAKPKTTRSAADVQVRRKRHADAERERIQRKQSGITRMRQLVEQLELRLRGVAAAANAHGGLAIETPLYADERMSMDTKGMDDTLVPDGSDALSADLRQLYLRTLHQSGWLRREKAALQAQLDDFGLLEASVESLLKDLADATVVPRDWSMDTEDDAPHGANAQPLGPYRPFLSSECYELMRECVTEAKKFVIQPDPKVPLTVAGWSAQCEQHGTEMRFEVSKTFANADLTTLMNGVWLAFQDSTACQRVFASFVHIERLQSINDDVQIVRWEIDCRHRFPYVHRSCNLVFRWKTDDGYFIGCRTLEDPSADSRALPPGSPPGNPVDASDHFFWAKFTEDASGGYLVSFAGRLRNGTTDFARFLLTGIPITIIRWECIVVGPLFQFSTTTKTTDS